MLFGKGIERVPHAYHLKPKPQRLFVLDLFLKCSIGYPNICLDKFLSQRYPADAQGFRLWKSRRQARALCALSVKRKTLLPYPKMTHDARRKSAGCLRHAQHVAAMG